MITINLLTICNLLSFNANDDLQKIPKCQIILSFGY